MRSVLAKKERVKIKNILPKEENMPKSSGEIVLRKDMDFDILCFDINVDGFYPARIRLWPQNHPIAPPTPDISTTYSSSDSG